MRQKLITLCPTSFELAGKKANFSAWVRRKLMEEAQLTTYQYGSYCKKCDVTTGNGNKELMMYYKCVTCRIDGEYLGAIE
tara:strand:+ start:59 stop:298 length:240 start_codon:yes stop_codon:yes gene_type:complete